MSRAMRDLRDEVQSLYLGKDFQPAKEKEYIDHSPDYGRLGLAYKPWTFFAAYTTWGVWTIERAFIKRMRNPFLSDNKRVIRREIQSNPHIGPQVKKRLLKLLSRISVKQKVESIIDHDYFTRIMTFSHGQGESFDSLERSIQNNTNISAALRDNLLYNLRNIHAETVLG